MAVIITIELIIITFIYQQVQMTKNRGMPTVATDTNCVVYLRDFSKM